MKKVREEEDDPMYAGMLHKLRYVMNREYTGGAEEEGEEDVRGTSGLYVYAPWIIRAMDYTPHFSSCGACFNSTN